MKNLIFDFETLGVDTRSCPVLSMVAYVFDDEKIDEYTPERVLDECVTFKFDVEHQKTEYSYKPEKSVVEFWLQQDRELLKSFLPSKDDLTINSFFDKFIQYLDDNGPINYWWSRSNTFDPPILIRMAIDSGNYERMATRLKYYTVRDIRTFIDALTGFSIRNDFVPDKFSSDYWNSVFKKHDPRCDVMADVMRIQTLIGDR